MKKDTEKTDSQTPFQHTPLKKLEEFEQQRNDVKQKSEMRDSGAILVVNAKQDAVNIEKHHSSQGTEKEKSYLGSNFKFPKISRTQEQIMNV